jgi:2-dehydro-3-deoxy-D-arabinonate dehydratase
MYLTRHAHTHGARWASDSLYLKENFSLGALLALPAADTSAYFHQGTTGETATAPLLAPIEPMHEVWAAGVTYLRSREARLVESDTKDIYDKVYDAERVELFFKAIGWRVKGHGEPVRVRGDSHWNVPEPELTLVVNADNEIVGYCVGNDVSSRDIEGSNPLYLPQAKIYTGSCALGPGIVMACASDLADLPIRMEIRRNNNIIYAGETRTSQMKRSLAALADWLGRELDFPQGVFLMTGTGIVPPDAFTLMPEDTVQISVASLVLQNPVTA